MSSLTLPLIFPELEYCFSHQFQNKQPNINEKEYEWPTFFVVGSLGVSEVWAELT